MSAATISRGAERIFALGLGIRESAGAGFEDPAALRARLLQEIESFAKHPGLTGVPAEEMDAARFALAVWLDEMIVCSGWAFAEQWTSDLLQLGLFGTNRGGNEFYDRLRALRPDQLAAREIYFLCLALGFEGQYPGGAEPKQIAEEQYGVLRSAGRVHDAANLTNLSTSAYDLDIQLETASGGGLWRIFLGWLLAGGLIYALLWGVLYFTSAGLPTS